MKPSFIFVTAKLKDRRQEIEDGINSEELIIELRYVSNGNTSKLTNFYIADKLSKLLNKPIC